MLRWVAEAPPPWHRSLVATPVGPLTVIHARGIVVAAAFLPPSREPPTHWFGRRVETSPPPPWLQRLVAAALTPRRAPAWRCWDPGLTPAMAQALAAACAIPFGRLMGYGELACAIGLPGRARLVGMAMSRSPAALLIPTHRVVRSDGRPVPGQAGGPAGALRAYEAASHGPVGPTGPPSPHR
jgi:methylated-DNA-[protein]-cysteine S-methyltransferase